jgi:hypothetical protein
MLEYWISHDENMSRFGSSMRFGLYSTVQSALVHTG